jgi:hypothetical protein
VTESDPGPEWVLTGSSCDDGSDPGSIGLAAGEHVTCTFTNTKQANIVVEKVTVPVTTTQTFTFTGDVTGTIGHGQRITVENVMPGTYFSIEGDPTPDFDLIDILCDDGASTTSSAGFVMTRTALFNADPGETVVCTFTNRERGMVDLIKLTGGQHHPTMTWTFVLSGTEVNISDSTPPTTVDFDGTKLVPGETYTLCETGIPSAWMLHWAHDKNGNGIVDDGEILPYVGASTGNLWEVYDPTFGEPDASNDNRCVDFEVQPGETVHFILDNQPPPGGDTRTPGYWKNWNTCSGGNQEQTAAKNGGTEAGWFLLDDLLPKTVGVLTVTTCIEGVLVLDHRDLEPPNQKRASDAAYKLARNLLAAKLNLAADAGSCQEVFDLVAAGDALLTSIDYDGTGSHLRPGDHLYQTAAEIAGYLDDYNNGGCAAISGVVPPEPPPSIDMYVESLTGSAVEGRRTWKVEVQVTIVSTDGNPVAGAKVSGDWSGADTGSSSCTTNEFGTCTVKRGRLPLGQNQITFTITGVSAEGYTYDSDHPANVSSVPVDKP